MIRRYEHDLPDTFPADADPVVVEPPAGKAGEDGVFNVAWCRSATARRILTLDAQA